TATASEGGLQGWVTAQPRVNFHQPMGSGQHRNEGIKELVDRRMLDRLLGNPHVLADRSKQIQLPQLHAKRCQTGTWRKMVRRLRGRFVHADGSPIFGFTSFDRY